MADYNNAAKAFNVGLSALCDELRSEFKNATVVCTDKYTIRYDLVANHTKYGELHTYTFTTYQVFSLTFFAIGLYDVVISSSDFENPLMACCGHGGPPYNYKDRMTCGQPTASPCPVGSRYVSWDGVHNTEAANAIIASKILSAKYSKPQMKLKSLCKSKIP